MLQRIKRILVQLNPWNPLLKCLLGRGGVPTPRAWRRSSASRSSCRARPRCAFVLLGVPLVFILGTVFLPGAASSFDPLTPAKWSEYLWLFPLVILVGGPLFEEIGWRGFVLPRLERKFGPLIGTIVLGLIWASWRYPQYMMPEWAAQNGGFNADYASLPICVY